MLTTATFGDIRTLDPANIGDGLVAADPRGDVRGLVDYDLEGKIVARPRRALDGLGGRATFRFVLREGVRFHDGEEVTADDVKRSRRARAPPAAPNPSASYFACIVGFADFAAKKAEHLDGVTVEGRYVVSFQLEEARRDVPSAARDAAASAGVQERRHALRRHVAPVRRRSVQAPARRLGPRPPDHPRAPRGVLPARASPTSTPCARSSTSTSRASASSSRPATRRPARLPLARSPALPGRSALEAASASTSSRSDRAARR